MTKEEAKTEVENALKFIYTREHTAEVLETLSVEPQGFEDYLKQYLGENDQMIIGKDVYEELKYEKDRLEAFMRGLYEECFLGEETYTSKEVYDMINKEVFEKGE